MSKRTCSVPDCERPHAAKSYCRMHWNRNRIHGDPLVTMKGKAHKVQHDASGLRICKACGAAKPVTDYHADKGGTGGYRSQCKPCRNSYMSSYYGSNREARVEYEQDRRRNKPEHMRALDMARYERHKDKRIALASDGIRRRRARMLSAEVDPKVTVSNLRDIHGDSCCYCGVDMDFTRGRRADGIAKNRATLEHVLPLSRGGSHTFDNTKLACHHCNVTKNNKTVGEWEAWKGASNGWKEAIAPRGS